MRSGWRSRRCTWLMPRPEKYVYPTLRRKRAIDASVEAEHSEDEHAEGHAALLAVLELKGTDTQAFDDAVEKLTEAVNHHLTEEQLPIPSTRPREEVSESARAALGLDFANERNAQLDSDCGAGRENVRAIVARAEKEGLLDRERWT